MKNLYLLLFISVTFTFINCKTEIKTKNTTTVLIGEVINRPYSTKLLLTKKNGDTRVHKIEIPIKHGSFKYILDSNFIQEFSLAFNDERLQGSWRPIHFFNDKDTIKMSLFEQDKADLNVVYGGKLNYEKENFNKKNKIIYGDKIELIYKTKFDSLYKINQWNSIEVQHIYDELQNNKDDFVQKNSLYKKLEKLRDSKRDLTPQARVYQDKIDSIVRLAKKQKYLFIEKDNSLVGYSMLVDELFSNTDNKEFNYGVIKLNLDRYQSKFKNHPFTESSTVLLEGIENTKIGNDYVDFSSKTKTDKIVKVSPVVKENTATLIDLWAPWCGPCIAKSKKLKPQYKNLKAKGLEVFAVIGGINSKDKYITNRGKYNYPWIVNYELDEEFKIWDKYNISRSGGSQFLISSKGKILAINPEPKEIDSILVAMSSIKL